MTAQSWAERRNQPGFVRKSRPWAQRQPRTPRPFPVAPLARRLGIGDSAPQWAARLAAAVGVDRRWIYRYRQIGLTLRQADEWAARAGVHPAEVWAIWDDFDRLRGAALRNAARETCPAGHPLDRYDSAGRRRCWPCPAEATRRWRAKKSANTQVTAVITQEAS